MKIESNNKITESLRKRTYWWFFLFLIVPCLLLYAQATVINGIDTETLTRDSFYTNTTNPSFSSLFLTNYIHKYQDGGSHIFGNISVYLSFISLIFILETFWIFPKDRNRSEKDFFTVFLFFFIFPFSISGVSLIIFRIIGGPEFAGFSGIVSAFIGYFWFLIYESRLFLEREQINLHKPQIIKIFDVFMICCFFIPILIFILINLLSYDNLGGHTTGYVLGFFSAFGMYLVRRKKYDKIIISSLFIIFIWIASTFWIFF